MAQLVIFGKRIHWVWGYPMLRTHLLRLLRKRFWFWWPPNWGGSLCNIKKNMRLGMLSAIYNGLVPFPFERCATYVCTTIVWFHLLQRAELWHHTGLTWSANQASQDSACGKVLSPKVSLPWASSWRCVFKTFKSHLDSWQTVRFLQVLGSTGD